MRIQHNIPAMSAYRNYTNNVSAMKKNLEKLSSGYRINRAGDDAAGLAISEKMRAQITGLQTAQKNAKDGISLVQTAEGALTEVHDMLNRMVTLAEQSANGTYDDKTDRAQLQKELDQLRTEINRIADSSNFNGIKLLDGSMATDTIKTALSVADPSMVDGSTPTAATKANITVKLNQPTSSGTVTLGGVTDGNVAGPATKTEITFTPGAAGIPVKPAASTTSTKVDGAALAAHAKNEAATFKITLSGGNTTAGGSVQVTVGTKALTAATVATNASAAAVAKAIADANTSTSLVLGTGSKAVTFKVTANGADLVFTATDKDKSLAGLGSAAIQYKATGALGAPVASLTNVTASTEHKVKNTYDLSGWGSTGDKIKIGDVTVNQAAAASVAALEAKLLEKGIKMNNADGTYKNVTFETIPNIAGSTSTAAVFNLTSDAKVEDLLDAKFGSTGKTVGELFELQTASGAVKASGTLGTAKLKLVAKIPGKMDREAEAALNKLANQGADVKLGADQGFSSGGNVSKYDFTFDIAKLEGGQFFSLGSKTFLFTIGSTSTVPTDAQVPTTATKIDLTGLDLTADKVEIAGKIRDELNTAFGSKFTVGAAVNASGTEFKINMTAKASQAAAANLGQVRFSAGSEGSAAMTATHTPYNANAVTNTGRFASATWKIDPADLKAGTTITIGTTSIKIVTSNAKAGEVQIATNDSIATKLSALKGAFEQAGFEAGQVTFNAAGSQVTVKEATHTNQTGTAFAAGAGMVTIAKEDSTPVNAVSADGDMSITTGTTKYSDILGKTVGSTTIGKLFNVTVNGKAVGASDATTFKAGDVINFEAKVAGAQTDAVMNKFKYTDGAVVTRTNGTDEGTGAGGANTRYSLNFNLGQISGGQTFAIGNAAGKSVTFEISLDPTLVDNGTTGSDEKINGDNVIINLAGMDPTTLDGQKAMAQRIREVVNGKMGELFDVTDTGDPAGGSYTLNLDAKGAGTDYNLGEVRISQANNAISGTYDPATSGATGSKGKFAQVTYDLDLSKLEVGDVLTIGGTSVKIVADGEETIGDQITVSDAKNGDKLSKAFGGNDYPSDQLKFANGKLTITGTTVGQTGADLAANSGKVTLTSTTRDLSAKTGGLTLQIGDTAESFNQLKVDIKDCHTAALGIGEISIADQDSAAKAVDAIKNAINYVSDVRGTLGATQNRLDHTINNLSVMTENIQDAESTIRDVDVAEEMMAYTKNNILIQSAQAMLAQANQMPQGVLQLLG